MRKGQRPSRHIRRVRTKRGRKPVRVNPHIRRKKRSRLSRVTGLPMSKPRVTSFAGALDELQRIEELNAKNEARILKELRAEQAAKQGREAALREAAQQRKAGRLESTKQRQLAYALLVEGANQSVSDAEKLVKDVVKAPNALSRTRTALTPYIAPSYSHTDKDYVPSKASREDRVHKALDLAIKTKNPRLIDDAMKSVIQLDKQLFKDEKRAEQQRKRLMKNKGLETYRKLQGRLAKGDSLTEQEHLTLKFLDPNTFKKDGPFANPGDWVYNKDEGEYISRKKIQKDLVRGEWQGVKIDPKSLQGQSTQDLLKTYQELQSRSRALSLEQRPLVEQKARDEAGLSRRGQKTVRRSKKKRSAEDRLRLNLGL